MGIVRRLIAAAAVVVTIAAPWAVPSTVQIGPAPAAQPAPAGVEKTEAASLVAAMSTTERAQAVVMGHISTTDTVALHEYMAQGFGGFILMGSNVPETEAELQAITTALTINPALPPLIGVDQEGGGVSRLGWDNFPSSGTLKHEPAANTHAAFAGRGATVSRAGINVNFGTVADFTPDRRSFIFNRALGTDAVNATEHVIAATTAQEQFVASTLKHFPGHGAAPGDSHYGIPSTNMPLSYWQDTEALPFAAGIDAGATMLMFGHLAFTEVDEAPASMSATWHAIARDDLGFDGVMVTDDMGMLLSSGIPEYEDPVANAVTALAAGNDLILMVGGSTPHSAGDIVARIVAAVDAGIVPAERLQDAAERVVALRLRISATSASWMPCAECVPAD